MTTTAVLRPGLLAWADLDPTLGNEQAGRRPVVILAEQEYLDLVAGLAIVMPVTSVDRGWINHIRVAPEGLLPHPSWIMTEQIRTISRSRIHQTIGDITPQCLIECRSWLRDFTGC